MSPRAPSRRGRNRLAPKKRRPSLPAGKTDLELAVLRLVWTFAPEHARQEFLAEVDTVCARSRSPMQAIAINRVRKFVDEACDRAPDHFERPGDLRAAFERWRAGDGPPISARTLATALQALGFVRHKSSVVRWIGLRIRAEHRVTLPTLPSKGGIA